MKIWEISVSNDNYEQFYLLHKKDYKVFIDEGFVGEKMSQKLPSAIEIEKVYDGKKSDNPYLSPGVLVVSDRAKKLLVPHLKENLVELIPLKQQNDYYYAINVLNMLDALDYKNSKIVKFSDGKIMDFKKFSFHEHMVKNQIIFKIPELKRTKIFVTDEFIRLINNSDLVGFNFKLVWSSVSNN